MNADNALTEKVMGAVFEVSNTLGAGFLEKVYERALLKELALRGIRAVAQPSLSVHYKGERIGKTDQRAHGPMHKLPASIQPRRLPSDQLPKADCRMEAGGQ
jgi:hypothetical protein